VLVPFVVKNDLHGTGTQLGFVFAAGGLGAVLTALVAGQRRLPRRAITVMYVSWSVGTAALIGFGIAIHLWQMYLVSVVAQSGFTVLLVIWYTLLQRLVPAHLLGRVASVDWLISGGLVPVSFALTGPLAAALGARATLIAAGAVGAAVIVVFLVAIPGSRGPERDGSLELEPVPSAV
jgi:hypothetical protein